jgi:protease-4
MSDPVAAILVENHPPKKKTTSFFVAIALGFLLLASIVMNFVLFVMIGMKLVQTDARVNEEFVTGDDDAKDKILLIPVKGVIMSGEGLGFFGSGQDIVKQTIDNLKAAEKDKDVKVVMFEVDSPGGSITDCDKIHRQIAILRKNRPDIKIVSFMGDIAASGGYYISAPADLIMAHPTTITGSIGVIMKFINIEGLYDKIGVKEVTIKSADKKDIGSWSRPMTEDEKKLLQDMLNEMYQRFVTVVDDGRKNLNREQALKLADGSIYTGQQALENGLVDKIGYFEDAVEEAKKLANLQKAKVVKRVHRVTLFDMFGVSARQDSGVEAVAEINKLLGDRSPKFMYMWSVP